MYASPFHVPVYVHVSSHSLPQLVSATLLQYWLIDFISMLKHPVGLCVKTQKVLPLFLLVKIPWVKRIFLNKPGSITHYTLITTQGFRSPERVKPLSIEPCSAESGIPEKKKKHAIPLKFPIVVAIFLVYPH